MINKYKQLRGSYSRLRNLGDLIETTVTVSIDTTLVSADILHAQQSL